MSASIFWRIVDKNAKYLSVGWGSSFMQAMNEVFGESPMRIVAGDADKLRAMGVAWRRGSVDEQREKPFDDLADAVEEHGTIEVWAEY